MGVYPEGAGPGEAMGSRHHGGDLAMLRQEWVWGGHPSPPRKYDRSLLTENAPFYCHLELSSVPGTIPLREVRALEGLKV